MKEGVGCLFMVALMLFQLGAGLLGLGEVLGTWAVVGALVLLFVFRFALPLMVGVFLCALKVWHLHLALAILIAAPGLMLVVPGMLAELVLRFMQMMRDREASAASPPLPEEQLLSVRTGPAECPSSDSAAGTR